MIRVRQAEIWFAPVPVILRPESRRLRSLACSELSLGFRQTSLSPPVHLASIFTLLNLEKDLSFPYRCASVK